MRRILVTNLGLGGRSGTETHVRDLVKEWRRRGHQAGVFALDAGGPLVAEMRAMGAEVVVDPRKLSFTPDIIHGHHNMTTAMATAAFPGVPALFVCHDARAWHDRAPRLPGIALYAAVDELCRRRVAADLGLPLERVAVVGNAVDLELFKARPPLPRRPRRALVFSSYAADDTFLSPVRLACRRADLELTVMGSASGNLSQTPWLELPKFDVVFGKARCAMEALACGCAVVLCGVEGVGPLVGPESFDALRRWNFGRHCLTLPHSADALCAALDGYDAAAADAAGRLARAALGLQTFGDAWEAHHGRIQSHGAPVFTSFEKWAPEKMILGGHFRRIRDELAHKTRRLKRKLFSAAHPG